jgi:hypothetical protein
MMRVIGILKRRVIDIYYIISRGSVNRAFELNDAIEG